MIVTLGAFVANFAFPALASLFWLWVFLSYLRVRRGHRRYWLLLPVLIGCLAISNLMLSLSIAPANQIAVEVGRAWSRLGLFATAVVLTIFTICYLAEALREQAGRGE